MDYATFLDKSRAYPLFKTADAQKWFPETDKRIVLNQLYLWTRKGYIERIRRSIYMLRGHQISDPFILAGFLYENSYVSLESALNSFGLIPDVPFGTTSVSLLKTKIFRTRNHGVFLYQHIHPKLFFGFRSIHAEVTYSYNIATPEKAIFDYFYLKAGKVENPEGFLEEMRLSMPSDFGFEELQKWSGIVPQRKRSFHVLVKTFLNKYAK